MQKHVPAEQSKVNLRELRRKPGENLELYFADASGFEDWLVPCQIYLT